LEIDLITTLIQAKRKKAEPEVKNAADRMRNQHRQPLVGVSWNVLKKFRP
jgi:hypothetical protein